MSNMTVLIVDDQKSARFVLRRLLEPIEEIVLFEAASLQEAREIMNTHAIRVGLFDIRLDEAVDNRDGLTLVREMAQQHMGIPIVVTSIHEMSEIRTAMRSGAYDYLLKDELCPEMVCPIIEGLRDRHRLEEEVKKLRARVREAAPGGNIIGQSKQIKGMIGLIERLALSDRPVLVTGPSGSGKELVVRELHRLGPAPDEPFIAVNCCALPEPLVESQLFGHEKGAFTGATSAGEGYFAAVGRGTLFLDEIGELPLTLQPKLLRVLELRQIQRVGSTKTQKFQGRVIAATHVDLKSRVRDGMFREDLYYRLGVLKLPVPSLEERRDDIPMLANHFAEKQARPLHFTADALNLLQQAQWPGNVRQLRNTIDRAALLIDDDPVDAEALRPYIASSVRDPIQLLSAVSRKILNLDIPDKMTVVQNTLISEALAMENENKSAAARLLGMHRKQIERWKQRANAAMDPEC